MEICGLTDCERAVIVFLETLLILDSYVTSDALHGSMAAGYSVALVVQAGRRLVHGETHRRLPANEN